MINYNLFCNKRHHDCQDLATLDVRCQNVEMYSAIFFACRKRLKLIQVLAMFGKDLSRILRRFDFNCPLNDTALLFTMFASLASLN